MWTDCWGCNLLLANYPLLHYLLVRLIIMGIVKEFRRIISFPELPIAILQNLKVNYSEQISKVKKNVCCYMSYLLFDPWCLQCVSRDLRRDLTSRSCTYCVLGCLNNDDWAGMLACTGNHGDLYLQGSKAKQWLKQVLLTHNVNLNVHVKAHEREAKRPSKTLIIRNTAWHGI